MPRRQPEEDDGLDQVWRALSNPTRRSILDQLVDGPLTTGDLAATFDGLSRFAVMQHLGVLEAAELIVSNKQGRQRFNHLNPVPIQRISDRWISRYERPLAEALIDLKTELESETAGKQHTKHQQTSKDQRGAS